MSNESINNEINVGALSEAINEKMDRNLVNADTIGQAILDRKVEVEALLEQNGYAKFTWKEDNKVASLIIQWGSDTTYKLLKRKLHINRTSTNNSIEPSRSKYLLCWSTGYIIFLHQRIHRLVVCVCYNRLLINTKLDRC